MDIQKLELYNNKSIRLAGPRYSPGVDPTAPNIEIQYLIEAFEALSLGQVFRDRVREYAENLLNAYKHIAVEQQVAINRQRVVTPLVVRKELRRLVGLSEPEQIAEQVRLVRRHCKVLDENLDRTIVLLQAQRDQSNASTSREERERLDWSIQDVYTLKAEVEDIYSYFQNPTGQVLAGANSILLLGSWGTGKTHLLCDIAQHHTDSGKPALLILAHALTPCLNPLEAITRATGMAPNSYSFLKKLDSLGRTNKCRALLLIDAINEGDRKTWRNNLAKMSAEVSQFQNIGLVVSCRRPFQETIVTKESEKWLVRLEHYGFEDQEFDAQQAFFSHYGIPAPQIPLLTPEFSKPLFLKLFCEAVKNLSSRSQRRRLKEVASGQKGLIHVLESFTKEVGRSIEKDFGLPANACWRLIKGSKSKPGIAAAMAEESQNWLLRDVALTIIRASVGLDGSRAEDLLRRMCSEGLLNEDLRWNAGKWVEVIGFPYERFGDQLIARHMLDRHLIMTNEITVKRCFYANRELGQVFAIDEWGSEFRSPGIAVALMLEFPERMKRTDLPRELIHYLPKARRIVGPIRDSFLEGLHWRSADSCTSWTEWLVTYLLEETDDYTRNETLEVLCGLATRPNHPLSVRWLAMYLRRFSMAERDLMWSEFLRLTDEHATVYRLLTWIERYHSSTYNSTNNSNEMRLLSLLLTTTKRPLRDRATRALLTLGLRNPAILFDETLEMLGFDDLYVHERLLAASYGTAMRLWADPQGTSMREHLPIFARQLTHEMFLPEAPHRTKHTLTRGYALGIIELAQKIRPSCIATQHMQYLRPGFPHINSPFRDFKAISEKDVEDARKAFRMDFENYTLGGLVQGRGNYDYDHPEYKQVRLQVLKRIKELGYSPALFDKIDRRISEGQWQGRSSDGEKTDRYGKKYSWIAYFEMYGLREDLCLLPDYRTNERSADCDVDPSFPEQPPKWSPRLPEPFRDSPNRLELWLRNGAVPSYEHLLERESVDIENKGPWILLDGYIHQAGTCHRQVFTFISVLFIKPKDLRLLVQDVKQSNYLGNFQIPRAPDSYYIYNGEIPWSSRFLYTGTKSGKKATRCIENAFELSRETAIPVPAEVPVHQWVWEGYHCSLNQVTQIAYPAPALCQAFDLVNNNRTLDLFDSKGHVATIYRELPREKDLNRSHLLYIRADLLKKYLASTKQLMVWILWGERTLHWKKLGNGTPSTVQKALMEHAHTFGQLIPFKF